MPLYEYKCNNCKKVFERLNNIYDNSDEFCPVCGSVSHKILSHSSFVLKGGGWYASGYSKQPKS